MKKRVLRNHPAAWIGFWGAIIAALILGTFGLIQVLIKPNQQPSISPTSTLSATTVSSLPAWLIQPTPHFGAVVPDHEFNEPVYPGQILSLSTDVGQFTVLDENNNPMTVQLQPQAGKSYVIVVMGDQTDSASVTLDVTGVSSGNIDWELRIPPAGTSLLPASVTVAERVASGLKTSPNCGNGCTAVSYYILDSGMHIKQTGDV